VRAADSIENPIALNKPGERGRSPFIVAGLRLEFSIDELKSKNAESGFANPEFQSDGSGFKFIAIELESDIV